MPRLHTKILSGLKKNIIKFLLLFKKAETSTDCYNGGYTVIKAKKLFGKIYITKAEYIYGQEPDKWHIK